MRGRVIGGCCGSDDAGYEGLLQRWMGRLTWKSGENWQSRKMEKRREVVAVGRAGRDVRVARTDGQEVGSARLGCGRKKRVLGRRRVGGCAWC